MQYALFVICRLVTLLIDVLLTAMMLRVILQWTDPEEDGRVSRLVGVMTEPVIIPVRALLSLFGIGEDSPMDIGFYVTSLLLVALRIFLPQVTL